MPPRKTKRKDGRFASTLRIRRPHHRREEAVLLLRQDTGRGKGQGREGSSASRSRRPRPRCLADWLQEWQATFLRAGARASSTKIMHAGYCRTWIVPTLGNIGIDRLTVADVNRLMLVMRDAGKADSTRRNCYTTLRKALMTPCSAD